MRLSRAIAGVGLMILGVGSAGAVDWVNEVGPPHELGFVVLQFPQSIGSVVAGTSTMVFGRVFHAGVTEPAGPAAQVVAELGYGPDGTDPRTSGAWQWVTASFNLQDLNDDEYKAALTIHTPGTYRYTYRFSLDGTHFTAADKDGAGANNPLTFDPSNVGLVTVTPLPPMTVLDIDGNGSNEPLTDGVLVLRYFFGFRGEVLTNGAVDTDNCERCDGAEIAAYFESLREE